MLHWKHCNSYILHEKCVIKWTTKSFLCTHSIQTWQPWADLRSAMTIHKILSLLISRMEQLLTANSGLLDNRCVFTTVISSNLSVLNGTSLIICLVVKCNTSRGTLQAGMLRINVVVWKYFPSSLVSENLSAEIEMFKDLCFNTTFVFNLTCINQTPMFDSVCASDSTVIFVPLY